MAVESVAVSAPVVAAPARKNGTAIRAEAFGLNASMAMWAVGGLFLVGSLIDVGVLWLLQRQDNPQWEFVAIVNTLEAFPRFGLAAAFFFAALYFRRSVSLGMYRLVAGVMVALGLVAALLGAMVITDYYVLSEFAQGPEALAALQSTSAKAVALSMLYFWVLVPLGILGARRPRG